MSLGRIDKSTSNASGELVAGIQEMGPASGIVSKLVAAACLLGLAACATTGAETVGNASGAQAYPGRVAEGRTFASLKCGGCHALDGSDSSPNWDAPPMKRLLPHLEFKMLERDRVQDAQMSHGEMPPLHLTMFDKEALVAYLQSIADSPGK